MSNPVNGWIKIHRKIEEWEHYFSEPFDKTHAWIDMLILANHEPKTLSVRGNLVAIERGELAWSGESLARRWSWSRGKVLRFLSRLETIQQIVQQKNNILSKIIILNYDKYQQNGTADSTTDGQQTVQQTDINKNVKNEKNKKGDRAFAPPTPQEVSDYCTERKNGIDPQRFLDFYASKGWMIGKNKMRDWKAAVRTWEGKDQGSNRTNTGVIKLHDGSQAMWRGGKWVDANNPNVAIDTGYYPELTKN
jgi:hypothetical protein